MGQIKIAVHSPDPLTRTGVAGSLGGRAEIVVQSAQAADTDVLVVAEDRFTAGVAAVLRRSAALFGTPVVLVADGITEAELLTAVECRVVGVVPRSAAVGDHLTRTVLAAVRGGGVLPANLVRQLLTHVEQMQREVLAPLGLGSTGLTSREIAVLRLMADGCDTAEIADRLSYSERMIKNVIHGLTTRLNLRNRPHAVAYALRSGII
ncbi:helix-turn-helix transcriptional regulator [Actinokineospora enzanensis]|uniref:helix-turn-helix transcriptional regulator n=1 Tax=Actinokineospora enzanensis TaxID=155975 RepID=UPI000372A462|nr:response regulator transcription factor [Actinokineospora enzanensis]